MADAEFESNEHLGKDDVKIKTDLCLVKTEIESDSDGEDCEADTHTLTEKINHEEFLYPVAVLTVDNRPEEGVWNSGLIVKQEVCAQDLVQVGIQPPVKPVFQNINSRKRGRPRIHCNETDAERLDRQRERNRLRKRRYRAGKSEEAHDKERERNRLYMRKVRATLPLDQVEDEGSNLEMCYLSRLKQNSPCVNRVTSKRKPVSALTPEQLERQRERNRNYMRKVRAALYEEERKRNPLWKPGLQGKRKPVIALTAEQLERQRERNRNYMRRFRASLTEDELQQRRERDRVLKRKTREMIKEQTLKLKHFFSYEQQWNVMREFYMNQMQYYQTQNGQLYGQDSSEREHNVACNISTDNGHFT